MKYSELASLYSKLESTTKRLEKTEILSSFLNKIKHEKNKEIIYLLKGRIFPDYDTRELGISSQLTIKALEKSTGINNKEIVKLWKKLGDLGLVAEQISSKRKQKTLSSTTLTTEKVLENLRKLPELQGKGTVEKKIALISELLTSASSLEIKYLIRTLLSDLRTGTGEGVLRDSIVWSCFDKEDKEAYLIVQEAYDKSNDLALVFEQACKGKKSLQEAEIVPGKPIKVMLAQKVSSIKEAFETVGKPMACFPKGESIFSNPSIKNIESFKEGEFILSSAGKFQRVTKTFDRPYSGKVIKIYPSYLFPFTLTPEHKLMTVKKQFCSWKNRKIVCRPNCQEQKYGCRRNYKKYKVEWTEAGNLAIGDFVLFPKFKEVKSIIRIDLKEFIKDKKIEIKENKIRSYSKIKGTFKSKWINRFVGCSKEFFELMGWYLAEGSFDKHSIKFSLGYKEMKEAERIKELIKNIFDIESKITKIKSVTEIKANSNLVSTFFKESFGNHANNKIIPSFIMYADINDIIEFLKAYIKGDGHKTKENFYTIVTASKNIAYQLILLLSKINILPSVGKYKNMGLGDIIYRVNVFGKQINILEQESHQTKTNHQRFFEDENFFYIPIRKIQLFDYNGVVFNLETEDNTYVSSAIVHNCEYKYDGFRMLINKDEKGNISIFTRRLENVTKQFPEVIDYVRKYVKGKTFVIDSEGVGYEPKTYIYKPFQEISQRIKRKYDIDKLQEKLPVEVNVFDILYYNGKNLLKTPYKERRRLIEKIITEKKFHLVLAKQIISSNEEEIEKFYKQALKDKQEGLMFKNLEAEYKPGARVGYMVKFKPEDKDFDLVITGAEYGTGKRAGWLTSFDVSCRDNSKLLEIGKVSTGLKEKEEQGLSYKEMTSKLKPLIQEASGRHVYVKPEIVVTVTYQNIQKSPTYTSGFALRFPRFTRLRPDRSKEDIATLNEIKRDYNK